VYVSAAEAALIYTSREREGVVMALNDAAIKALKPKD
jgi:hypothetical protein